MKREFEQLEVKNLAKSGGAGSKYFIYTNEKDYSEIEAQSASEAIDKSGVKNPFKIVLYYKDKDRITHEKLEYKGTLIASESPKEEQEKKPQDDKKVEAEIEAKPEVKTEEVKTEKASAPVESAAAQAPEKKEETPAEEVPTTEDKKST